MTDRYEAIANDRDRLERTARNSIRTLSTLYADRAHFILELLQNAEDALRRRPKGWCGSRDVKFSLSEQDLRQVHFGKPFDQADVQAICSVGETTKELTDIGRFGIGFKSVYAFTDRPEVHSGQEDFAIEDYVRPTTISPIARGAEETIIRLPRKVSDEDFNTEIEAGLKRLGPSTLLFLREVETIDWNVKDGPSGLYLRGQPECLGDGVRRITVIGQADGRPDVEESWLLFSKPAYTPEGTEAGQIEVAFSLAKDDKSGQDRLRPVSRSPLVVFFPTVVETHFGFLAQGPYRTTPSRNDVPSRDAWNQYCVRETAAVSLQALRWLRDKDLLDIDALRCLPLDGSKFGEGAMFAPVFEATREALTNEPLLPRYGGGYVSARRARLARTQELLELFSPPQMAALLGTDGEYAWLSGDISQNRTPDLWRYLIGNLGIEELRPETILPKFNGTFLEAQPHDWIRRLYEFLGSQKALLQRVRDLPLVRLTDGKHVRAHANGQPQAFLSGDIETGFPTVQAAVCNTEESRAFLKMLGLSEPDPVDDVIRNILPKYHEDELDIADDVYEADFRRIVAAFATDSKNQRDKLIGALSEAPFVRVIDTGDAQEYFTKPGAAYLATDRLKELFAGVPGVLRVDERYACLRGEDVRGLLEACGAARYLRPTPVTPSFTWEQLRKMRIEAGCESISYADPLQDNTLHGLGGLLEHMQGLDPHDRKIRAECLWDALADLEDRRKSGVFLGTYIWYYYHRRIAFFDAAFVRLLNEKEWVPDAEGNLQRPNFVTFDSFCWKPNPFLQSKIHFKPPIIDQLAKEAGIEPGVLDLLRKYNLTSAAELRERLGIPDHPGPDDAGPTAGGDATGTSAGDVAGAISSLLGNSPQPTPPVTGFPENEPIQSGTGSGGTSNGASQTSGGGHTSFAAAHGIGTGNSEAKGARAPGSKPDAASGVSRPFISYVAVHPDDEEPDPDGLDHKDRMELEAKAIDCILSREPEWRRTPPGNPGFDLYQLDDNGEHMRWCEVKAMKNGLSDRPVGLSRVQFDCAREHGPAYWLYVVEHAGETVRHIVRIQDPAGKACTFTFDHGWIAIAAADLELVDPKE
jgi:hypothetical protein